MKVRPRNGVRALVAVFVAVLLSGCAVDGLAVPEGGSYRSGLGPDHERAMEVESNRDRARLLDPCGMLDKAALVAEVGTLLDIGPDIEPDRCRVVFDRSATVNEVVEVDVQLSVTEDGTGELFRIGERTASVLPGGNSCHIGLTYDDIRTFLYSINGGYGTDVCEQLRRIVIASAPLLDTEPKRADSLDLPETKAWTLDPCAPLSVLYGPEQSFDNSGLNPFECDFRVGEYSPDEKNRYTISYMHLSESLVAHPHRDSYPIRIAEVDATERTLQAGECLIQIYVGAGHPFPTVNTFGEPEQWFEVMQVLGHGGCEETRRVATAAVGEYKSA